MPSLTTIIHIQISHFVTSFFTRHMKLEKIPVLYRTITTYMYIQNSEYNLNTFDTLPHYSVQCVTSQ